MAGNRFDADDAGVVGVVSLVRPEVRRLLRQYRIPSTESMVELLERALVAALRAWGEKREQTSACLLAAVRAECRAYWRERGVPSPVTGAASAKRAPALLVDDRTGVLIDLDLLRAMLPLDRLRVVLSRSGEVAWLREAMAAGEVSRHGEN
jgi:hypothetical protein